MIDLKIRILERLEVVYRNRLWDKVGGLYYYCRWSQVKERLEQLKQKQIKK